MTERQKKTAGLVIASLVLGILGVTCIGPLGAIPAVYTAQSSGVPWERAWARFAVGPVLTARCCPSCCSMIEFEQKAEESLSGFKLIGV